MTTFTERAQPLISKGIPVIIVPPRKKGAVLDGWQHKATTDLRQVITWNVENPDYNVACVAQAKAGGFLFFEVDQQNFHTVIEQQTGKKFPETFLVASTPGSGKGHFYFRHTPDSIRLFENQAYITIKGANGKEACSLRGNNAYVIGPQSVKEDGVVYTVIKDAPIADCPDFLVDWFIANGKKTEKKVDASTDGPIIPHGSHDTELTRIAGVLRNAGMSIQKIEEHLIEVCEKRCEGYGSDYKQMCSKIAHSIGKKPVEIASTLILGGQPVAAQEEIVVPKLNKVSYPVFPDWVMAGTSLYEGFVKPVCDINSRIPYFMFLPAAALMLNYVALKVKVQGRGFIPSIFMTLIGSPGVAIKSSCVEDAIEYLQTAGVMSHASGLDKNADGKSLVWTAGSPEGLGLEMSRLNSKNAVLFYDELSTLTSKAEIESSSLKSSLLTLYESGKFSNTVKSRKETFSYAPRTYCMSLIACTTDAMFEDIWARLAGKSTGLDDRFMFVLQPKELAKLTPKLDADAVQQAQAALKTRKLIDKAVQQGIYELEDSTVLEEKIAVLGNRCEIRAEKWALYFAVDLGLDSVTPDAIERGIAVAEYERAVKKYLGSPEAESRIAGAQLKYRRVLERKFEGRATVRDMEKSMHSQRYGTEVWYRMVNGLKQSGIIAEVGGGTPGSPKEIVVRVPLEE
jgi:Bifunctional DNA primase/polymerase, N-terminal